MKILFSLPAGIRLHRRIATGALSLSAACLGTVHAKPGDVDRSFGENGHAFITEKGRHCTIAGMAIQKDGKIVVAGNIGGPVDGKALSDLLIARFTRNGKPDVSFGHGGKVRPYARDLFVTIASMAIDAKGRIVCLITGGEVRFVARPEVARYLPDGTLDPSFGEGGKVVLFKNGFHTSAARILIQKDGKIVVLGSRRPANREADRQTHVFRLLENGTPDSGFGEKGIVKGASYTYDGDMPGVLLPDERILVIENVEGPFFTFPRFTCLLPDGQMDQTYGTGGSTEIPTGDYYTYVSAATVLPGGGLAFCGWASATRGSVRPRGGLLAGQLTADGLPAPSFHDRTGKLPGWPGIAIASPMVNREVAVALDMDAQGRLLFAGNGPLGNDPTASFGTGVLVRFHPDGRQDTTFGRKGRVTTPHGISKSQENAVAVQADGKILVGGGASEGETGFFAITRLEGGGPQPDARLGLTEAARLGDDIYQSDGGAQSLGLSLQKGGASRDVYITIENDGTETDSFTLGGRAGSGGYRIAWFHGKENISRELMAARLETGPLAPGKNYQIRTSFSADAGAEAPRSFTITATSLANPVATDRVVIVAKVKTKD